MAPGIKGRNQILDEQACATRINEEPLLCNIIPGLIDLRTAATLIAALQLLSGMGFVIHLVVRFKNSEISGKVLEGPLLIVAGVLGLRCTWNTQPLLAYDSEVLQATRHWVVYNRTVFWILPVLGVVEFFSEITSISDPLVALVEEIITLTAMLIMAFTNHLVWTYAIRLHRERAEPAGGEGVQCPGKFGEYAALRQQPVPEGGGDSVGEELEMPSRFQSSIFGSNALEAADIKNSTSASVLTRTRAKELELTLKRIMKLRSRESSTRE